MTASRLRIAPIVEGHGEYAAVRPLLERIGRERLGLDDTEVLRPIRQPRAGLARPASGTLQSAVEFAARQLLAKADADAVPCAPLALVLFDADDDCAATLGPQITQAARAVRGDFPVAVNLAVRDFETWCVASARSLAGYLDLAEGEHLPVDPEAEGRGKAWIRQRFRGNYSPPVDQPKLAAALDLDAAHDRCPSFARLCRLMRGAADAGDGGTGST